MKEKNLTFTDSGSYWLAGEVEKCRNYLAGISLCWYCSSGCEDYPCSFLLDLTLTSDAVASNGCGHSELVIFQEFSFILYFDFNFKELFQ